MRFTTQPPDSGWTNTGFDDSSWSVADFSQIREPSRHGSLYLHFDQQFVAFYNAERDMTIGQRTLGEKGFRFTRLPAPVAHGSQRASFRGLKTSPT